jgi:hypothetical protein
MRFSSYPTTVIALLALAAAPAIAGPDWTEGPIDAGKNNGQNVPVGTPVDSISGTLGGTDSDGGVDVADSYVIDVNEKETFIATTQETPALLGEDGDSATQSRTGAVMPFNAAIFLFRTDRFGIVGNRDISSTDSRARIFPTPTDGSPVRIPGPGRYILAISYGDVFPVTGQGQALFNFDDAAGAFQVSGPDGTSMPTAAANWFVPSGVPRPTVKYRIRILGNGCRPCLGDANQDLQINFTDITTVLANWGNPCP